MEAMHARPLGFQAADSTVSDGWVDVGACLAAAVSHGWVDVGARLAAAARHLLHTLPSFCHGPPPTPLPLKA